MERKTKQRDAIWEVLESADRPLSIQEILDQSQILLPNLGIATIYRAIKELIKQELIMEVSLKDCSQRYELKTDHHHHFVCRVCEFVFCIAAQPINSNFMIPAGFVTETHDITLRGICAKCVS